MAQGTPLSARRGLPGWLQLASSTSPWLFYQVSSEVFSKSSSVMSQVLHQLLNVSKGDVPMAFLPDPTTAASEPSSVKNRLTGSRIRGSGINRDRSRTVRARASETSRKTRIRQLQTSGSRYSPLGARRLRGGRGGPGGPGLCRGVQALPHQHEKTRKS